jgi:cephalosporin hydroxylase
MPSGSDKRITIDMEHDQVIIDGELGCITYPIGTPEAFAAISKVWLRSGWDTKYVYNFSWLGRPIIQLPEDMVRLQEVIFSLKPDLIIETGVAHGGSLIFYASLCKVMEKGRIVGVDIEIRPHNRKAIETHPLFPFITLIEGSSIETNTVEQVKAQVKPEDKVLVLLDACHTKEHVLAELNAYAALVTEGSYIVAMDGIMERMAGAPRTQPDWVWNNPISAAHQFVKNNPKFIIEEPPLLFNEGLVTERVTYWPSGFIKRIK